MCLVKNVLFRARAIISLHHTIVSRPINKEGQALPSGQFDIWHPWSETLASSYIRQMVAGGRSKMKGSGRDLTSAHRQIMEERETLRRKLDAVDTDDDNMEGLHLI